MTMRQLPSCREGNLLLYSHLTFPPAPGCPLPLRLCRPHVMLHPRQVPALLPPAPGPMSTSSWGGAEGSTLGQGATGMPVWKKGSEVTSRNTPKGQLQTTTGLQEAPRNTARSTCGV